ncbi:hypothetical protein, partial [Fictibacillus fluitans]
KIPDLLWLLFGFQRTFVCVACFGDFISISLSYQPSQHFFSKSFSWLLAKSASKEAAQLIYHGL